MTLDLRTALAALAIAMLAQPALAKTIVVKKNGSIQDAVDQARPGDVIKVNNGVYSGVPGSDYLVSVTKSLSRTRIWSRRKAGGGTIRTTKASGSSSGRSRRTPPTA